MLHVRKCEEQGSCYQIENPVFIRKGRNGMILRWNSVTLAQGVVSPDGEELWQFADRETLGEDYDVVEIITEAEYIHWLLQQEAEETLPDPEDTQPEIPENVDPATILTRAELTEKVTDLEEAMNLLLSGVTEDE